VSFHDWSTVGRTFQLGLPWATRFVLHRRTHADLGISSHKARRRADGLCRGDGGP
jgi:hypothetical protein